MEDHTQQRDSEQTVRNRTRPRRQKGSDENEAQDLSYCTFSDENVADHGKLLFERQAGSPDQSMLRRVPAAYGELRICWAGLRGQFGQLLVPI